MYLPQQKTLQHEGRYYCHDTQVLVVSPESQNLYLPIPHLITPAKWSLIPCTVPQDMSALSGRTR